MARIDAVHGLAATIAADLPGDVTDAAIRDRIETDGAILEPRIRHEVAQFTRYHFNRLRDRTPVLPHLVYGDWEWDDAMDRPAATYPCIIYREWSGGVEFATDRDTLERIVNAQSVYGDDAPQLRFDDEVTCVLTDTDGETFEYTPDRFGLYHVGFGWTWMPWTPGDEKAASECRTCGEADPFLCECEA